jgi:antitoxin (DNA-binding transcriptional repressor) of toxin-antitoxin stability system
MLRETSEDIQRQTAYVANERANLTTLAGAIKNGEEVIKAGESVSKSDLGDDYDQLVEEGVVSDSKPNPTNDPVVGAMLPVDEREGLAAIEVRDRFGERRRVDHDQFRERQVTRARAGEDREVTRFDHPAASAMPLSAAASLFVSAEDVRLVATTPSDGQRRLGSRRYSS